MRKLLILILCLPLLTNATTYYVSSSYTGGTANGGFSTPWKTISSVNSNMGSFNPGDSILFKRGDKFGGRLNITCLGTSSNRIYFGNYGTGNLPLIQQAGNEAVHIGTSNTTLNGGIIFDGFNITDTSFDVNDKITQAPTQQGITIGEYNDFKKKNITIRNCTFSNIGGGVVVNGDSNIVEYCTITNMKNVQNTFSTTFPGNDNDYGANPFTFNGDYNVVRYCYISGGWAESEDYGWNGGAFEMFDNCNGNKFLYNTIIDCGGVAEYGAFANAATANDNLYAYNRIINCGNLSWVNTNGTFAIQANNIMYFNNVIIENYQSRFSGPNTGAGIVTPRVLAKVAAEPDMLAFSGTPTASVVYNMRNNIFLLRTGAKVVRSSGVANKTTHQNNIYCNTNTTYGYTLGGSEAATTSQIFKDTSNANPNFWDYHLTPSSPARGIGQNLSSFFSPYIDYEGKVVASPYDVGIYQYSIPVVTQLRTRLKFKNSN